MSEEPRKDLEEAGDEGSIGRRSVSRRDFLKIAGVSGAAIGLGAGLGGLLAACGEEETTTTTAGPATTAAPDTTATTAAPETTTTIAAPEMGREIKVGVVSPLTGIIAVFAVADKWGIDMVREFIGDEIVLGDGKLHKVSWLLRDTQSDDNRASQVTSDLILNDQVDLLTVGGSPTTGVPAAVQAETLGCPLIATNVPWQAWIFGRGMTMEDRDKWSYGALFGIEQGTAAMIQVLDKIPTNKKAGLFFGNTIDTDAWMAPDIGMGDRLTTAGYEWTLPSRFNLGTEDFSDLISAYKSFGCEINCGSNPGMDFPNFWQQCAQQGYNPKVCVEMIGLSSTDSQIAMGDAAFGIIQIFTWHADWPYVDSITGFNCRELADRYEADQEKPWDQFITGYMRSAWAVDILQRTKDLDDKESVLEAIKTTKLDTILGPVDFTGTPDPAGQLVTPTVFKTAVALGQHRKGTKWPVETPMVAIVDAPGVTEADLTEPTVIEWS